MIYGAIGGHGDIALVTVEASRSGYVEEIESICVDIKESFSGKPKRRIIVKGSDDWFPIADELHNAVSLNIKKE
jgi:hypothetical protein